MKDHAGRRNRCLKSPGSHSLVLHLGTLRRQDAGPGPCAGDPCLLVLIEPHIRIGGSVRALKCTIDSLFVRLDSIP